MRDASTIGSDKVIICLVLGVASATVACPQATITLYGHKVQVSCILQRRKVSFGWVITSRLEKMRKDFVLEISNGIQCDTCVGYPLDKYLVVSGRDLEGVSLL